MGLSSNGMGPALVTWESLQAWCSQMRHILDPWEKLALVRLGYTRAVVESEKMAAEQKRQHGAKG